MDEKEIKKKIFETVKSINSKSLKRRQLYHLLRLKKLNYNEFKRILDSMIREGDIIRTKGRHLTLPERNRIITGVFTTANKGGYIRTGNGVSYFVKRGNTEDAVSGDTVQARVLRRMRSGLPVSAKILKILERTTRPVIGIFRKTANTMYIKPRQEGFSGNLLVKNDCGLDAKNGDLVVARIEMPSPGFSRPMCVVTEVLGDPDAPGMDIVVIARRYGLPLEFPENVLREAKNVPADFTPDVMEKRKDIRSIVTFTIDPVDAKDFDDAISISRMEGNGYEIGVHIADVSHYVSENSAMDNESRSRGMSCYLLNRVIPMLPEKLSNELCSLKPDVDRLTKSVFVVLDGEGAVVSREIANTVIHSRMRLNYRQAQAYLEGKKNDGAGKVIPEVGEALELLSEVTDLLIARRKERGAIDMELPEAIVILDDDGRSVDIQKRNRIKAHRMVEEAMLLANTIVAETLGTRDVPFLYRIHEEPDNEKMEQFSVVAAALGYEFHTSRVHEKEYMAGFLNSLAGKKHEQLFNMLLLRSMKKACYSPHNRGHYGLSLPVYAHFTSPIRRYPDLIVHRQLDKFVLDNGNGTDKHDMGYYETLGDLLTEREINSDSAERDLVKMKTAEFMKTHLGEEFEGRITGILPIGFFVELDRWFVEGLVHVSSLEDDYYETDRSGISLKGKRTGMRFMIGDRVRILVAAADKENRRIDFALVQKLKTK
ncbi:ribonuclease R [Candidatus Latescibacterota bacterium]